MQLKVMKLSQVTQYVGLSRPTIYRKISDGTFPKPVRISTGRVGWFVDDVDVWLATLTKGQIPQSTEEIVHACEVSNEN